VLKCKCEIVLNLFYVIKVILRTYTYINMQMNSIKVCMQIYHFNRIVSAFTNTMIIRKRTNSQTFVTLCEC